ncbi:amino acid ABC transporter membrane protein 1, PAAT family [Tistlia consotensis]|uniref:Amino acid ABC transporter membrane protein 1, PAAT family n=1 Tax=Tistlia consotensis USBA 355 TaxID=560819 RepID=A0A1Y6BD42_9PROT|nr:amino acid ABC transporter permease [Tistlia consotensis]SMF05145.1 amino acid ABC transporter membrane protein 1, PAAT family [Tistlia consotensis USBA 355]SNR55048.1 amino acid ABC transporter membrane protein 1, PAAT family [Tistlia consotensis]
MAVDLAERAKLGSSLWTDQRFRGLLLQALTIGLAGTFLAFIVHNTAHNLAERGIASGFGFLDVQAGYELKNTLISYGPTNTHGRAFLVGLLNTLLVAGVGVVLATVIGFILGVLRLSPNWLLSKAVYCYIEVVRNIPLLLQIYFWYAVMISLPQVRNAMDLGIGAYISNRGLQAPAPILEPGFSIVPVALLVGILIAIGLSRWAHKRQEATGQRFPSFWINVGLIVLLPVVAYLGAGRPMSFDVPKLGAFSFRGGFTITPEFVALLLALSLYTAAFIAEIVRAGILSVSHGQTEAAYALGLKPRWTMRLIIIPQALRVIVPPLTSQYLNLTKNSSLGVAIGYAELVATLSGITLNQTGQAVECIALTMAVYLTISLMISFVMNIYNRRIALVER